MAQVEALTAFLAQHERLWRATAHECGVEDPEDVPRILAQAHGEATRRLASEPS